MLTKIRIDKSKIEKIMILGSIGIGNLLMFSPALDRIRAAFPGSHITMVVLKPGFKQMYECDKRIDEIYVIDSGKDTGKKRQMEILNDLRSWKFDLSVTTFPANRMEYNLIPFWAGARYRVAHRYDSKFLRSLSLLQNLRVRMRHDLHDLDQNLNLVSILDGNLESADKQIRLHTCDEDNNAAAKFLEMNGLNPGDRFFGIHPGSSTARGMDFKQWEPEKFGALGDLIAERYDAKMLIFGGPEEERLKKEVASHSNSGPLPVNGISLRAAAELIGMCRFFVTNDSGLMHISVAMDTQTFALFGPSDPLRTAPYGKKHIVIRKGLNCSPCWNIRNVGLGYVPCIYQSNICMQQITVNEVFSTIQQNVSL